MDHPPSPPANISLCMIVRDSEDTLGEALASARPWVDEMVVVDTGSTDNTPAVAQRFEAKLFHFAWCDDFSAARNRSLEHATGDWVFWMDADDILPPAGGREIRRLVDDCPDRDSAFWVGVQQPTSPDQGSSHTIQHGHIKLFPRDSRIRFRYRVHEQVAPALRELGLKIRPSQAFVQHANADRSPDADARRHQRNLRLLRLDLDEHPDDPFVLLNLGLTYKFLPGGREAAISYVQRSIEGFSVGSPTRTNAQLTLGDLYRQAGDHAAHFAICQQALEERPRDAVVLFRLGVLSEQRGEPQEALQFYDRMLQSGQLHLSVVHPPDIHIRAALRLGRLLVGHGKLPAAETFWQQFLERYPQADAVRRALHELYLQPLRVEVTRRGARRL